MIKRKHYLFSISSHGLGHLSQASAVVNELVKIQPQARINIRSSFDKSLLKQWLVPDFTYYQIEDDIGMRMNNALDADLEESYKAYAVFHNNWFERVQTLAIELQDQCITLVLSDIAYLPLAAAQRAGIPNIAICSLNWADVVECYMVGEQVDNWLDQIKQVYQAADFFITPTPSMSMPWLEKKISVSPIGRVGKKKRKSVLNRINIKDNAYVVLVGMGGMSLKVNSSNWPLLINEKPVYYILNDSLFDKLGFCSSSFFNYSQTGLEYHDLMASVDLMLTKPGYGTFVEAVAVGLPLIYISRDIWPDVSSLVHWLEENGSAIGITRTDFLKGMFANEMKDLLDKGHYVPTLPDGAIQSASYIVSLLSNQEKGGN